MSDVVLRAMRNEDLPEVAKLERTVFTDPWSEASFRNEIAGGRRSWIRVAQDTGGGAVAAYLVAWFVADEVHLGNVAVATGYRRRGLAQRLLDEMLDEGVRRNARLVTLEVRRSNQAAQGLYRKNGFYTVMIRRAYYQDNQEDALVMVKPLREAGRIPPLKGVRP